MTITMHHPPGPSGSAGPGRTAEPAEPAGFMTAVTRTTSRFPS
jgi:hypothetical protein